MSQIIDLLVKTLKDEETMMDDCLQITNELLEDLKVNLKDMGSVSSKYILEYDNYLYNNVMDGSILKNKLKDSIVKVIDDDI